MGGTAPAGTATSTARTASTVLESQSLPDRWVPFPNTADQSFRRQPEGVSRFASQTRSGTTPNLRKQPDGDRAPRTSGAPNNILPAGYGRRCPSQVLAKQCVRSVTRCGGSFVCLIMSDVYSPAQIRGDSTRLDH
jgi:hypothetical protein